MNIVPPVETPAVADVPLGPSAKLVMSFVPSQLRGLALQLREDWSSHYRDASLPGFRAVAVHRFGTWVQRESGRGIVRGPVRFVLRRWHLALYRYVRNHYGIELPQTAAVGRRVVLGHQSGIVIHPYASIGDDCIIRQNVTIGALSAERDQAPAIGRRVELGAGATIVGNITIGDDSRIGPHSVVMTDVPPGSTVFVNPPRMITLKAAQPVIVRDSEPRVAGSAR